MRISDWSSDVCSSDLFDTAFERTTPKEASESRCVPFWHIKCFTCAATIMCSVASGRLYRSHRGSSMKHLLSSTMALTVALTAVSAEAAVIRVPSGSEERQVGEEWGRKGRSQRSP